MDHTFSKKATLYSKSDKVQRKMCCFILNVKKKTKVIQIDQEFNENASMIPISKQTFTGKDWI